VAATRARLRRRTNSRDCAGGYSQSEANEITRKRDCARRKTSSGGLPPNKSNWSSALVK